VLKHAIEDYPQLVVKWKAKGNQNRNRNIQKISTEIRDEGPKIIVVTCVGTKTGIDATNERKHVEKWVMKSTITMSTFNP
jgi:hypothetical protein